MGFFREEASKTFLTHVCGKRACLGLIAVHPRWLIQVSLAATEGLVFHQLRVFRSPLLDISLEFMLPGR